MDFFGLSQFKELLDVHDGPAVSIFVNADRQDLKGKNNQIAFQNQVRRAKSMLRQRWDDPDACRPIEQTMDHWVDDGPFWGSLTRGVAAFFSPNIERIYRLDTDVDTDTVVGDHFHTRPMIGPMLAPKRCWVLAFDRQDTRLFEVSADRIDQVSLGDIPTNMDDALQLTYPSHPSQYHSGGAPNAQGAPSSVAGSTPAFETRGNDRDLEPRHIREFAQIIDKGLVRMLADTDDPVILAAPEKFHGVYRSQTNLKNLADDGLKESLAHVKLAQIRHKAWPLAKRAVERKLDDILALWEREYGFGKGESDLQQIAKRTIMSQVRYVLIEEDRTIWGRLDRDAGQVDFATDRPAPDADTDADTDGRSDDHADRPIDLLDALAELVIARGGQAFVMPAERMPVDTGAAAILRGLGPSV